MKLDLLSSIEIVACAAIAIAILSIGFGATSQSRIRIATGLGLWFVLVTVLGATEVLHYPHGVGAPGMGVAVLLPIVVLGLAVRYSDTLFRALRSIPLPVLIGINSIRVLGVTFVILYAAGRLPAPFAPVAGWGDILVGLTAAPVAWLASRKGGGAHGSILLWNSVGLLDLITAVVLGVVSSPGPLHLIITVPDSAIMTTLPWVLIPGFLVPLLASTHLAVFYRLSKRGLFIAEGRGMKDNRQRA